MRIIRISKTRQLKEATKPDISGNTVRYVSVTSVSVSNTRRLFDEKTVVV